MNKKAVVGFYINENKQIAVVTRKDGRISLPGGKVEENETLLDALLRECEEEGWKIISLRVDPIYIKTDETGYETHWFYIHKIERLEEYKDKSRNLFPFVTDIDTLIRCSPGFNNDFLVRFIDDLFSGTIQR
ncbi:MAG: NUDIX hydrolase [Flavobacterium sp.]|uniref:NUDIX hydrolase n=1 Tax=Flavobacterium sp. TaxID=239 RepID=UPI00262EB074|nr:NUDIX hydrolase [Flavobacterium sp.]MDD5150172.1 NUDIX hydrolase [Flavobacterium sp.]